ncbi:hypothetical protein SH2C18_27910 [Clostridium sediminicola]|uniref:DUF4358 domain-containing protein n=1 Tax=Clostridium sediminicola TaxID=3114879 RepID=UPI0031F1E6A2
MKKNLSLLIVVMLIFTLVGCGKAEPQVPVRDIMNSIEEEVEGISKLSEIDLKSEELEDFNKEVIKAYNINTDDVAEGIMKFPMINLQADEVIIIKVNDKVKIAEIEEALKGHIDVQLQAFENYVPQNYELVKNHILESNGKYILLTISKDAEKIQEIFNTALN